MIDESFQAAQKSKDTHTISIIVLHWPGRNGRSNLENWFYFLGDHGSYFCTAILRDGVCSSSRKGVTPGFIYTILATAGLGNQLFIELFTGKQKSTTVKLASGF